MVDIEVKQIGLAAYMKMNGCLLVSYVGSVFLMKDPRNRSVEAWSLDYSNSCCQRHDSELLVLRDTVRRYNHRSF